MKVIDALILILLAVAAFALLQIAPKGKVSMAQPQTDSSGLDGLYIQPVPLQLFDVNQLAHYPDGSN